MATTASSCNAAALRSILRLIHCLQRERGASCALAGTRTTVGVMQKNYVDSTDSSLTSSQRRKNVKLSRDATNAAVKAFYRIVVTDDKSSCDLASKLFQVRQHLDEEQCHKEKYQFVHNIIREFSSILSFIIRVHVTENIIMELEHQRYKPQNDTVNLLKLLLSFVELKESLGVERAALTGIMSIGNKGETLRAKDEEDEPDKHGLPIIVNDVVMVVENQRRILSELQRQSGICIPEPNIDLDSDQHDVTTPPSLDENLLRLISNSIKQSDEMKSLQDHIRKDFDMNRFHEVIYFYC